MTEVTAAELLALTGNPRLGRDPALGRLLQREGVTKIRQSLAGEPARDLRGGKFSCAAQIGGLLMRFDEAALEQLATVHAERYALPHGTLSSGRPLPTRTIARGTESSVPQKQSVDLRTRQRIAGHLKLKMKRMGWTQAEVARRAGVDPSAISRIFSLRSFGLDLFIRINRGCGIDAEVMLNSDPKPNV